MERLYGPYPRRLARLLAFLGRYAHQPANVVLQMEVDDFSYLVTATGTLLDQEAPATPMRE